MDLQIRIHTMWLYTGHRSVYANVTIGRRTWWISRWDTARVFPLSSPARVFHRGPVLTWYGGLRRV